MSSQIPLSLSLGRLQRPTRRFPLWVNPDFVLCNDPAFLVSFPRFIDERSGGVLAVEEGKRLFTTSSAKSCAQYQVLNLVDARCVIGRFDHEKFVDNQVANAHILSFSDVVMSGPKASCAYGDVVHSPARPLIFSTWPDLVNPARCMCFIAEPWSDTSIPTPSVLLHVGVVSWDDFLASHNCRKLKLNSLTLPIACLSEKNPNEHTCPNLQVHYSEWYSTSLSCSPFSCLVMLPILRFIHDSPFVFSCLHRFELWILSHTHTQTLHSHLVGVAADLNRLFITCCRSGLSVVHKFNLAAVSPYIHLSTLATCHHLQWSRSKQSSSLRCACSQATLTADVESFFALFFFSITY